MKRREEIVEMWPKNCTWSGLKILTFLTLWKVTPLLLDLVYEGGGIAAGKKEKNLYNIRKIIIKGGGIV